MLSMSRAGFSQPDRVIIIDDDPVHAAVIEQGLVSATRTVTVFPQSVGQLDQVLLDADVVVLVIKSPFIWRAELVRLHGLVRGLARPPELLCLLRWRSRGPEDRLYGDRYDARVLHER